MRAQDDPDPDGHRLRTLRRALTANEHIVGFFFDFASLYQRKTFNDARSAEEEAAFQRALGVVRAPGTRTRPALPLALCPHPTA